MQRQRSVGPHVVLLALCLWGCDRNLPPSAGQPNPSPAPVAPSAPPAAAGGRDVAAPRGAITGRVVYRGPLPETTTMYVFEAAAEMEAHTIIADRPSGGLKNAAVWLEGDFPRRPVGELAAASLDQRRWTFVPHVLAVRAGQTVELRNSDVANHNVHSWSPGEEFNVTTPMRGALPHCFRRATGDRPVLLGCDIHHWMRAWVYAFDHDGFAVSEETGHFRIDGVPPGRWRLRAHHADGGLSGTLDVEVPPGSGVEIEIEVRGAAKPTTPQPLSGG
jgi:plastocyanin